MFEADVNGVILATGRDTLTNKSVQTTVSLKGDISVADMDRMIETTNKAFHRIGTTEVQNPKTETSKTGGTERPDSKTKQNEANK